MYKKGERPVCPYCRHKPFKTPTGYRWHLTHIHPDQEFIPVGEIRTKMAEGKLLKQGSDTKRNPLLPPKHILKAIAREHTDKLLGPRPLKRKS